MVYYFAPADNLRLVYADSLDRISTHWRWVVMLFIIVLGLSALAIGGWFFHRRYHRRREAKWSNALGAPDITTWGPGQSVHDLGYYGSGAGSAPGAYGEKAKAKEQTRGVNEPPPARMKENRLSKF